MNAAFGIQKNPICVKAGDEINNNIIDLDNNRSINSSSCAPPIKSKNLVKIIYFSEEGHKARVDKSKILIGNNQGQCN